MPSDTWIEYCNIDHIFFMIVEYEFSNIMRQSIEINCIKMYNSRDGWYHVFDFQNGIYTMRGDEYADFIKIVFDLLDADNMVVDYVNIINTCGRQGYMSYYLHTQIECPVDEYYIMTPSVLCGKLKKSGLDQLYIHHD